ncbi:hypothetical protein MES5069_310106 [Mesorhizobium escarrei]|uniref:Uncharacterized protein n=1 Tax=Mesorhizobium escarrei TaxID=666018 RepID=A0ABM9DZZ9_9HYPH|nr:hypothetical protein MES5069_310106 [Mesorhizobium escarrei]
MGKWPAPLGGGRWGEAMAKEIGEGAQIGEITPKVKKC